MYVSARIFFVSARPLFIQIQIVKRGGWQNVSPPYCEFWSEIFRIVSTLLVHVSASIFFVSARPLFLQIQIVRRGASEMVAPLLRILV